MIGFKVCVMKKMLCFICFITISVLVRAIQPGVVDIATHKALWKGKKVGLVANQTSVVNGLHTLDFLQSQGMNVVRIFCPEHGFRGEADAGESVNTEKDAVTGLTIVSLYGKKKKPSREDLKDIDLMLFDIQDVGVRFYTYLSTLHYVMEACAENQIPVCVTDRPNPNAFYVDGPVLDMKYQSFVGMHPVPIVYGMTIGEYARMINEEGWLKDAVKCALTVIPCRGWRRDMTFDLPVKPSPNLPDRVSVMLYPSVCLFEGTVVSEGRGTHYPFQMFGHPDLVDMPYSFVPQSIPGMSKNPKCLGQKCYGMDLREQYHAVKEGKRLRLDWLLLAYRHYQGETSFFTPFFEKLAGTDRLQKAIENGLSEEEIRTSWLPELEQFERIREKYLIY